MSNSLAGIATRSSILHLLYLRFRNNSPLRHSRVRWSAPKAGAQGVDLVHEIVEDSERPQPRIRLDFSARTLFAGR